MGGGFNKENFSFLYSNEEISFWFKSRNKMIIWLIYKYLCSFKKF